MPVEEVLEQPENINSSPRIPGTLEVHKIARTFSTDGICKMEFYYTAVDEKPFNEQWYRKDEYPDVCSHTELRTNLVLHVLSAMELMQQIKNGWNATYAINSFMKSVFSFKNSFCNIFLAVLKVLKVSWQIVLFFVTYWRTDILRLGSFKKNFNNDDILK